MHALDIYLFLYRHLKLFIIMVLIELPNIFDKIMCFISLHATEKPSNSFLPVEGAVYPM